MLLDLLSALALDLVLGEPPIYIHPVVMTGKIAEKIIKPYKGYIYGIVIWIISVFPVLFLFSLPTLLPTGIIGFLLIVFVLQPTMSIKLLYKLVSSSLDEKKSREFVQQIVRRDLSKADLPHIWSAAIESLFESLVDGITSPLFWFLLFGIPGSLLQRLGNTMDSMVGYKTDELRKEGYFSAKVDTIMNYIPARITGLIMIIAGRFMNLDIRNAINTLRQTHEIESVNAKYPISIVAGLLGVKLEKEGFYAVGNGNLPTKEDVEKALRLFKISLTLYLIILLIIYYCLYGFSIFGYPYGLIKFF
ncbi:cobalamin biosynthesis protein [Acidianus sp. RZ1]|uniref:cobalamin biosynthesis protein n=1 Tax=Acidianus sp. RZ1 TaxID=1540082 RepID=UPI001490C247|nr:cobalamin biosynthesis protein [Acidianus sp. RZ1]NON62009.1 cobalamin biosynthesis protein [Acidianus sp. RZ1]